MLEIILFILVVSFSIYLIMRFIFSTESIDINRVESKPYQIRRGKVFTSILFLLIFLSIPFIVEYFK